MNLLLIVLVPMVTMVYQCALMMDDRELDYLVISCSYVEVTTLAGQYVIFNGTKVTTISLVGTDFTLVKLQSCPYCIEKWTLLAKGPTTTVIDIQVCVS